jgi:hypothetical protein
MKTKNKINGNKTKNHAILGEPDLHIKFNIQVHRRIYSALIIKITAVLDTSQVYDPTQ